MLACFFKNNIKLKVSRNSPFSSTKTEPKTYKKLCKETLVNVSLKKSKEKKIKKPSLTSIPRSRSPTKKIVKKRKIKKKKINSPPKWSKFNKKKKR